MSEWQPIETAPKDGTRFVGITPTPSRRCPYTVSICHWEKGLREPRFIFDDWAKLEVPTLWMPLPAPPAPPVQS
jgi:hypothetical protein